MPISLFLKAYVKTILRLPFEFSCIPIVMGTAMAFGDGIENWLLAAALLFCIFLFHSTTFLIYYPEKFLALLENTLPYKKPLNFQDVPALLINILLSLQILTVCLLWFYLVRNGDISVGLVIFFFALGVILFLHYRHKFFLMGCWDILGLIILGPFLLALAYFIQSQEMNLAVALAGFAPGFFSVSALMIHNLRDLHADKINGKQTFAVLFGMNITQTVYLISFLMACLTPVVVYSLTKDYPFSLFASSVCVFAVPFMKRIIIQRDKVSFEKFFQSTRWFLVLYGILFSLGWII